MGKVLGIVAEYNPFHNGHLYHLDESKKITKSNYTVAIMSGNFTERGSTSLIDKWSKAEVAINCGIDLVIELPVLYSISSAENFAEGSIKILDSLKVVDYISFGAETSNIETLNKIADILNREPRNYKSLLTDELNSGISFPKARENALRKYSKEFKNSSKILSMPNNILAIEYLKALKKYKSTLQPIIIPRYEAGYNDLTYTNNIASSTAIRNVLKNDGFNILQKLVPSPSYSVLVKNTKKGHIIPDISVFEKEIMYTLRKMSINEIKQLPDVSEGLEFAIKNAASSCNTIFEFLNIVKSKRYTSTRLQRILLYTLLNITKNDIDISRKISPYVRVLGFNSKGKYLLSKIAKENPKLDIITSVKNFTDKNLNKNYKAMLEKDLFATNVYTLGYNDDSWSNLDFTKKIVTL